MKKQIEITHRYTGRIIISGKYESVKDCLDRNRGANFSGANFSGADFSGADLSDANFSDANFSGADLSGANFSDADLRGANFSGANFSDANFSGADFSGANFSDAIGNEITSFFYMTCPEEGSFIGWKKCRGGKIVKLLITEDSKRSSATSRKCRASKVKVLEVLGDDTEAISTYTHDFIYKEDETIEEPNFDDDRWNECSSGIHFFITKAEAEQY